MAAIDPVAVAFKVNKRQASEEGSRGGGNEYSGCCLDVLEKGLKAAAHPKLKGFLLPTLPVDLVPGTP